MNERGVEIRPVVAYHEQISVERQGMGEYS
jgi:hypothetical protein